MAMPFTVGAAYWPADRAMYWWQDFSSATVARDFDRLATFGITCLRISLPWTDFQPDRRRVSLPAMRDLERVLMLAGDRHIRLQLTLLPVTIGGVLWLPTWSLTTDGGRRRVVSGTYESRRLPHDLWRDAAVVEAEKVLCRELLGAFAQHPAAHAWVLGDRLSAASGAPGSVFADWLGPLVEDSRRVAPEARLLHGISVRDLVTAGIDLRLMKQMAVGATVALDWAPEWAAPGARWTAFVASCVTSLAGSAAVTGLGACTGPYPGCVSVADAASEADVTLQELAESGAEEVFAASAFDYSSALAHSLPFDEHPQGLFRGLFREDGAPKPAMSIWGEWSARKTDTSSPPVRVDDPDEWARRPQDVIRELWSSWR